MVDYEKKLLAVSEAQHWTLPPSIEQAITTLQDVATQYGKIASRNTELKGKAAEAATESFDTNKKAPDSLATGLGKLTSDITTANDALDDAKTAYNALPGTEVESGQKAAILAAGGVAAGPLGVLVGEAGIAIWQDHLQKQRDNAAKDALAAFTTALAKPSSSVSQLPTDFPKITLDPQPIKTRDGKPMQWTPDSVPSASSPSNTQPSTPSAAPTGTASERIGVTGIETQPPPPPHRHPVEPPTSTTTGSTSTGGGSSVVSGVGGGSNSETHVASSASASATSGRASDAGNGLSVDSTMSGGIAGGVTTAAGVLGGSRLAGQLTSHAANAAAEAATGGVGTAGGMSGGGLATGAGGGGLAGGGSGSASRGVSSSLGGRAGSATSAGARAAASESAEGGATAGGRASSVVSPGGGTGGGSSDKKRASGLLGLKAPSLDDDGEPRARSAAAGPGGRGGSILEDGD